MGDDNGRITISEDKLYRALGDLELRLVEKLATKDEVHELRKERESDRADIESLKRWRAYLAGLTTTAVALAGTCAALVIFALTH